MEAGFACKAHRLLVFAPGYRAVEGRMFPGAVFRPVLDHDVDIGVARDLVCNEPDDLGHSCFAKTRIAGKLPVAF
ncbi:MAG: hypothetical protein HPY52_09700 [Firmicutes bacterium]|nr:hypothetical protein [Bacillota bacterium]